MALAHRALPARGALGCVLAVDEGIYEVWTSRGRERASMGGGLLADVARDRAAMPLPGDWVELTRWRDGRLTLSGRAGRDCARPSAVARPHLRLVR
ncbi:MAG: hypothetical protein ACTHJM_02770 [Marmoricola sp.]